MEQLSAPKINAYITVLEDHGYTYNSGKYIFHDQEQYEAVISQFFDRMKEIKPVDERTSFLWLRAPRGPIEDFGDFDEEKEYGNYSTYDDFRDEWLSNYPNETVWFSLHVTDEPQIGYRAIFLNKKRIYEHREDPPNNDGWPTDLDGEPFAQWLLDSVNQCIEDLKAGTYNDTVNSQLPLDARTGTITRKDLWDILPDLRKRFSSAFSDADRTRFLEMISEQEDDLASVGRIPVMTANLFYTACAYGYAANPQRYNCGGKTPKELYYMYADGRDDGLKDIPEDDPAAFLMWLVDSRHAIGHPWEVMRGGNSTHVSLFVHHDATGFCFELAGVSVGCSVETMKFYLALREHGLPVFLEDADVFVNRLKETEIVGIVPQDVTPKYCRSLFPDDDISSFMNLPWDEPERSEIAQKAIWQTEISAELQETNK